MPLFQWPAGQVAAVSLKFDDGLDSQLHQAAPMLTDHGFAGTFYLCPAGTDAEWIRNAVPWKALADAGHEIGNHTLTHPIPAALADDVPSRCYENMTLEQYADDVLEATRRLELLFSSRAWTFCYPCYQTWVGVGRQRQSVVPFIAEHFLAAVVGAEISRPYNPPTFCDLHALMSVRGDGLNAEGFVHHIKQAARSQRWVIFTFHDIERGRLPVPADTFQTLLAYLSQHRDQFWVAPIIEIARYIRTWQSHQQEPR